MHCLADIFGERQIFNLLYLIGKFENLCAARGIFWQKLCLFASPLSCGGAPTPVQHDAVRGVPSESIESVVFLEFVAGAGPFAIVECITGLTIESIQNKLFMFRGCSQMTSAFFGVSNTPWCLCQPIISFWHAPWCFKLTTSFVNIPEPKTIIFGI